MARLQSELVQTVIEQSMACATDWLRGRIQLKLEAQGVQDRPDVVDALVAQALSKDAPDTHQWSDGTDEDRRLTIEFTAEDDRELDEILDRLRKAVPEIVSRATKETSDLFASDLKKAWPAVRASLEAADAGFRERLEERWGKAFDLLRMMHYASVEIGQEAYKRLRRVKSQEKRVLRGTLIRLHARAVQTTAEIITLMENGFADGAMARWRTLHEITVVALIVQDGGYETAKRYLDHELFDALQAAKTRRDSGVKGSDKEVSRLEKRMEELKALYGKEFGKDFGWAAHQVKVDKGERLGFSALEKAAGKISARPQYRLASYNVHADSKGLFFRLGSLDDFRMVTGRSNAGLDEPGINTAYTLTQMTMLLMPTPLGFDELAQGNAYVKLRDWATRSFIRIARKLSREHIEVGDAERAKRAARGKRDG